MQNQQLFETPFGSNISTNYYSKSIRSGAGKFTGKRCQGMVSAPLSPNFGSNRGDEAQWLFEAPFPSQIATATQENYSDAEALFEFEDLTREQMASFLQDKWNRYPVLRRLANAQRLRAQALHRELINILSDFERTTRITVQVVPEGTVQRLRNDPRNFSSLRSRPGFYQIEQQVFRNTSKLLKEVRHELAYHYAGGPGKLPTLRNTIFNALMLLEFMIQGNGQLPPPVAPISPQGEAESLLEGGKSSTNPWPRQLAKAREMLDNARQHLAANNLRDFDTALTWAIIWIDRAEAGILSRISPSSRLARITVETTSAKHAIQVAQKNRTNPVKAESELNKAINFLLAARTAVGLKLV